MKRVGVWNYYTEYNNGRMFDHRTIPKLGEDLLYPFQLLKQEGIRRDIDVSTADEYPIDIYKYIVSIDDTRFVGRHRTDLYLFESPMILPKNWDVKRWTRYSTVYTWNPTYEGRNVNLFRLPVRWRHVNTDPRTGLVCMIASHKSSRNPNELYSERIRAIEHMPQLEVYGYGWNRWPWGRIPNYKGTVVSKTDTLKRYMFSVCYENGSFPGYVSEKMFDCMFSGTVPIYLGDPLVTDTIPAETFIDKRDYKTYDELIADLTVDLYEKKLKIIQDYVYSDKIKPYRAETFVERILEKA